jgi:hypothetical protein
MRGEVLELDGTRFERTGVRRPPRKDDWFLPAWGSSNPLLADHDYPNVPSCKREILRLLPAREPLDRRIKATRSIVGIVGKAELPCGCFVLVCLGKWGGIKGHEKSVTHLPVHNCPEWKKHKYDLSKAEKKLHARLRNFYYQKVKNATRF